MNLPIAPLLFWRLTGEHGLAPTRTLAGGEHDDTDDQIFPSKADKNASTGKRGATSWELDKCLSHLEDSSQTGLLKNP